MANEKRLIDANGLMDVLKENHDNIMQDPAVKANVKWREAVVFHSVSQAVRHAPTVDAVEVVHGQRLYNAHEVAEIIADLFGDTCACNFNGIDEWLPYKCELLGCCPNTYGVACWEQYLKFRDGERRTDDKETG